MKIKSLALSFLVILILAVPVFAQVDIVGPETHGALSPITGANAQAGATADARAVAAAAVFNRVDNTNVNIYAPHTYNRLSNRQAQGQIQLQDQFGYVAPVQTVNFSSPTQLLGVNVPGLPELNFGNGKFKEITKDFPMLGSGKIAKFDRSKEKIIAQIHYLANERYKTFYGRALTMLADIEEEYGAKSSNLRVQYFEADAQKTVTGGVNGTGVGSALSPAGTTGGGGGGVTGFQLGGTKAQPLLTMIVVEVRPL